MNTIKRYCTVDFQAVTVDGNVVYKPSKESLSKHGYLSEIYHWLGIDYRKFFKMDALSKLGFLSAELLLSGIDPELPKPDMAIVLFNCGSSLDADETYQRTISDKENFFPSPAEFVYTLPNIVTGEIAIRNKIYGETMFYVFQEFHPEMVCETVHDTMSAGMRQVLAGWIDVYGGNLCSKMMLCGTEGNVSGGQILLTANNICEIFI